MRKKQLALAALTAVGLLIPAACSNDGDSHSGMSGMQSSTPTTSRTDGAVQSARQIETAQMAEIATMEDLLS